MRLGLRRYKGKFLSCARTAEHRRRSKESFPAAAIVAAYKAIDPDYGELRDAIHFVRSAEISQAFTAA